MSLVGEHRTQAGALLVGEQVGAGTPQHSADAIERVADASAVPAGVLLDTLAATVILHGLVVLPVAICASHSPRWRST
jgi:hypothetical protein